MPPHKKWAAGAIGILSRVRSKLCFFKVLYTRGKFFWVQAGFLWVKSRKTCSCFSIAWQTMSRVASSSTNLSPFSFMSLAPSPRSASVSMNVGFPGAERTVGWNCTCSMSMSLAPASFAISMPSPVEIGGFVVWGNFWPMPPVVRTVVFA